MLIQFVDKNTDKKVFIEAEQVEGILPHEHSPFSHLLLRGRQMGIIVKGDPEKVVHMLGLKWTGT
jgi:hypothetical protein